MSTKPVNVVYLHIKRNLFGGITHTQKHNLSFNDICIVNKSDLNEFRRNVEHTISTYFS